jgi:hypothetical protein
LQEQVEGLKQENKKLKETQENEEWVIEEKKDEKVSKLEKDLQEKSNELIEAQRKSQEFETSNKDFKTQLEEKLK